MGVCNRVLAVYEYSREHLLLVFYVSLTRARAAQAWQHIPSRVSVFRHLFFDIVFHSMIG
jgi:hypothetical protein